MKTVAFNGSPNKNGNTFHALQMVLDVLAQEGIETEMVHVGNKAIRGGCIRQLWHQWYPERSTMKDHKNIQLEQKIL